MELLQDGLIAFFSAVGVSACLWLSVGALLGTGKCHNPEVRIVLPVSGAAPAMEADVRSLVRVRYQVPGAAIVIRDCGLSGESREIAEYLCRRYAGVELESDREG